MLARGNIDANDISDLVGKRLPYAFKKTSMGHSYYTAMLAASGISYDEVETLTVNTFVQARDAFSTGKVDVTQYVMGTPFLEQLTASVGPLKMLSITYDSKSEARVQEINPALRVVSIPVAPAYAGEVDHIYVLEFDYMIYTHKDMPDDIVEKMATTLIDGVEEMAKSVRAFENMDVSKIGQSNSIPFHPAAIKTYQARGLAVSSK